MTIQGEKINCSLKFHEPNKKPVITQEDLDNGMFPWGNLNEGHERVAFGVVNFAALIAKSLNKLNLSFWWRRDEIRSS